MSLQNLLNIGQLEEHETTSTQVRRMIASAERSLSDAQNNSINPETRLDAAYRVPEFPVWAKVKVHGNAHVQFEKCQYSVLSRLVRQHLWLKASETLMSVSVLSVASSSL